MRGLDGIEINAARMAADLDANWAVLGEAVQQAMRAAAIAGATVLIGAIAGLYPAIRAARTPPTAALASQ